MTAHDAGTTTLVDTIRHGQPEGGQRYRGHLDDPLSHLGWHQMWSALDEHERWDAVLTSPLLRCRAFAQAVADRQDVPLHVDERLKEISFGDWEGLKSEEILARYGDRLSAFWSDSENHPPPGGERISAFHGRVAEAWAEWLDNLRGQRVLLVCHGGVIRVLLAEVLGASAANVMPRLHVPYACRTRFRIDDTPHGRFRCLVAHGARP